MFYPTPFDTLAISVSWIFYVCSCSSCILPFHFPVIIFIRNPDFPARNTTHLITCEIGGQGHPMHVY